jgi:RimJ/RimL family protein N-acetyltransferase
VRVREHESAIAFLARVEPVLEPREREHHLILGIANALPAATFLTVERGEALHVAAIVSAKRLMVLSATVGDAAEALEALASWLPPNGHHPPGFIADVPHAEAFARTWARLYGREPRLKMRQRLHALTAVTAVPRAPGQLQPADAADIHLLLRWQGEFNREAMGRSHDPELRDQLARRLDDGEIYLWIDGEPRSMAASARPTRRGVAINSVYTPPELRGRGYATSCVAALSQQLLDNGKRFCVLYTDVENPTSNAIYARLGYHPVADSLVYELRPANPDS